MGHFETRAGQQTAPFLVHEPASRLGRHTMDDLDVGPVRWRPRTDPTCFPEGEDMDVLAAYAGGRVRLASARSGKRQW
jgi:hypothetical protein